MEGSQMKIGCMPFAAPLVRAILEGTKTQTRRVVKLDIARDNRFPIGKNTVMNIRDPRAVEYAPYQKGDILWIREPGKVIDVKDYGEDGMDLVVEYIADGKCAGIEVPPRLSEVWESKYEYRAPNWALNHQGIPNGVFKEAARLFIKITNVRVEWLRDISEEDAESEVVGNGEMFECGRDEFQHLWDSVAKPGTKWTDSPWVWVYEFERTDKPSGWPGN
ncbi:hypothetical protein, partial [Pseudodesulfovibrio karagichevae]